jgi:hypothetical protein
MVPRNAKYIRRLRSIAEEMVLLTPWLQEIWISVRFADDVRWERWNIVSAPGEKICLRSPHAAETLHPQIYGGSHLFYGCANAEKVQLFWRDLWKTRKVTQNRYRTRCCVDCCSNDKGCSTTLVVLWEGPFAQPEIVCLID